MLVQGIHGASRSTRIINVNQDSMKNKDPQHFGIVETCFPGKGGADKELE